MQGESAFTDNLHLIQFWLNVSHNNKCASGMNSQQIAETLCIFSPLEFFFSKKKKKEKSFYHFDWIMNAMTSLIKSFFFCCTVWSIWFATQRILINPKIYFIESFSKILLVDLDMQTHIFASRVWKVTFWGCTSYFPTYVFCALLYFTQSPLK